MPSSADGLTPAEHKKLSRPFERSILNRAEKVARTYRLILEADPDGGYIGSTAEFPLVMGGGETIEKCASDTLEATITVVAMILERGESPPSPASLGKRDRQVNIRLTVDEKQLLEEASRREGFRSLSDFLRSVGLNRAG